MVLLNFMARSIVLFILLFITTLVIAQTPAKKELKALRINEKVTIDGKLDEEKWQQAEGATDFVQYEPYNGAGPTYQSVFKMVYDDNSVYVGAIMYDPEPGKIMRELGHEIVAWDEEALVHLPPEMYYSRRLSTTGMVHVSHLFAWGEDNAELWRKYPHLPPDMPIHVTGNPRGDLLRPEIGAYYSQEADVIRKAHGRFILVNTNFNHVNAFYPAQNLFQPVAGPGDMPEFGQAARGMSRDYAEGLRDHKQAVLDDFLRLIPDLEKAFPDCTVVVRPHPTENQEIYSRIASRCTRVKVTNEGNVIPWLLAAQALIHNGCTTGVEAFAVRVPSISFRKTVNDYYDDGFYKLSNRLSHQCFNFEELQEALKRILEGRLGAVEVMSAGSFWIIIWRLRKDRCRVSESWRSWLILWTGWGKRKGRRPGAGQKGGFR